MVQERRHPSMTLSGDSHRGPDAAQAAQLVGGDAGGRRRARPSVHSHSCEESQGRGGGVGSMVQERRHPSMTLSGDSHRGSNVSQAARLVGGVSGSNVNPAVPITHGLSEEIAWRRWHRGSPLVIPKGLVAQKMVWLTVRGHVLLRPRVATLSLRLSVRS